MAFLVQLSIAVFILIISVIKEAESVRKFTLVNDCKETIWPGIISGDSSGGAGFTLKPGQSTAFTVPEGWIGRMWGRTGCKFDSSGTGPCQTGGCGSSLICSGSGVTPASLAEFTLGPQDYYDVSLVDGYNLPVVVTPVNGKGNCTVVGCNKDMRDSCPTELTVKANGRTVACKSACEVFQTDEYCCRGLFGNPESCPPTIYSKQFKDACPSAYSYAYDDRTSLFTCVGADYVITFCSASVHARKRRTCTYQIYRLVCDGSCGFRSRHHKWPSMLVYTLMTFSLTFIAM